MDEKTFDRFVKLAKDAFRDSEMHLKLFQSIQTTLMPL